MSDEIDKYNRFWLDTAYAKELLLCEKEVIASELRYIFGLHILQIGCPQINFLGTNCRINHKMVLTSDLTFKSTCSQDQRSVLFSEDYYIPLRSETIDAVVVVHDLEFSNNPKTVLREIDRILLPEGHLIIIGFNPWSLWGARSKLTKKIESKEIHSEYSKYPWDGNWMSSYRICDWLGVLNYAIELKKHFYYKPFINIQKILNLMSFFEHIGKVIPLGSAGFCIVAKKKREAMLTLRTEWQSDFEFVASKCAEPTMKVVNKNRS